MKMNKDILMVFLFIRMSYFSICSSSEISKISELLNEEPAKLNHTKIYFEDGSDVKVHFPVKNDKGKILKYIDLELPKKSLTMMNIKENELQDAWIKITPSGKEYIVLQSGATFPLDVEVSSIAVIQGAPGHDPLALDMERFRNMTMKDIEGDPTLLPDVSKQQLNMTPIAPCKLEQITIDVNSTAFNISINDNQVVSYHVNFTSAFIAQHVKEEGLVLLAINPGTCKVVYEQLMHTAEFGGYHDFFWGLKAISDGRLVLLVSLRDGSSFIPKLPRKLLSSFGAAWAWNYAYRDIWVSIFIKGGKYLGETIIPNLSGSFNFSSNPVKYQMDMGGLYSEHDCKTWPNNDRWRLRRMFCARTDGYGDLCSCSNPLEIKDSPKTIHVEIPILVVAGNRTRHLYRLLWSLADQEDIYKQSFLLVTDGHIKETATLADILGLKLLVHRPEGVEASRIARTVRFALYNGLQHFPEAKAFILLEEDLYLSIDFYSYMKQMQPIFGMDKSIYCVNAFNHLSYPYSSTDPSMTYRTQSCPAYGWMMSREIVEEILPRFLPASKVHDWDYFVGSILVRGKRECIIPDINRSYHWSSGGYHTRSLWVADRLYLSRNVNQQRNVKMRPVKELVKENYEVEMETLIRTATPLVIHDSESYDILESSNGIYVIYARRENETDDLAVMTIGEELNVWSVDVREHHHHCWRFYYEKSLVLIVGHPLSKYSHFKPVGHPVFVATEQDEKNIKMAELHAWSSQKIHIRKDKNDLPTVF